MAATERPRIAVTGLLDRGRADDERLSLSLRYAEAVARAGGSAMIVAPIEDPVLGVEDHARSLLMGVDGLLLSGGDDFDTERIGLGPTHPEAVVTPNAKQDLDLELARAAITLDLPVLGICYGMQCLALAGGGGLHQHIPEDRPGAGDHTGGIEHEVLVEDGTKLLDLLGVRRLSVISRHHQAISDAGPDWTIAARDANGLVEAVERGPSSFALGVQWHPELSPAGSPHGHLFHALVTAAREHARRTGRTVDTVKR